MSTPTTTSTPACMTATSWPRERVLFALAGSATVLSAALSALVSPWFLVMTTAVGLNELLLVVSGRCPASLFVDRVLARRWS